MNKNSEHRTSSDAIFAQARATLNPRPRNPRLQGVVEAISQKHWSAADALLLKFLAKHPNDAEALNLKADAAMRSGLYADAEALLARCVELSPDFVAARFNYANVLFRLTRAREAVHQLNVLLQRGPDNPLFLDLKAAASAKMGEFQAALECRQKLVEFFPDSAKLWVAYGHALRAVGQFQQCISAFRTAIELAPSLGDAYWSLANLKVFCFTGDEIDRMETQLARTDLSPDDRASLHYALGKALGDLQRWSKSFENYAKANAIVRLGASYDPDWTTSRVANLKARFTPEFFRSRMGSGCRASDPIFIIGMQRAGSTLVEQILASHSAIEGVGELTDIAYLSTQISDKDADSEEYWEALGKCDATFLEKLGERYLESTAPCRKLGRPYFTDKQPYNFWHLGLIQLILPNAKIIEVRRHPMGCCFSNFTHRYTTSSRPFTHRLSDLGRYYRDYVDLMVHFDRALPGKIYRVIYERLVEDPESEIRRLLDHLALPFETGCLEFYRNERELDSASSEQVRSPIFRDGVERWHRYEPWLGPLRTALGMAFDSYSG
jgi:tetratricopeptide (TPR) repeat protein